MGVWEGEVGGEDEAGVIVGGDVRERGGARSLWVVVMWVTCGLKDLLAYAEG